MDTYSEFVNDLQGEGSREGSPGVLAEQIDGPIAENYPCPECAGAMVYRPWLKPTRERNVWTGEFRTAYRAFAVCERCDSYSEF